MQHKLNISGNLEERCAWMRERQEWKKTHKERYRGPRRPHPEPKKTGREFGHGTTCNTLSQSDAAYLAGFFDGEGCACVYRRKNLLHPVVVIAVTVVNTNFEVVEWIQKTAGVGRIFRYRDKRGNGRKDSMNWQIGALAAGSFLEQLLPFLIVKRKVAELCLRVVYESIDNPNLCATQEWQDAILREGRRLNRRGPSSKRILGAGEAKKLSTSESLLFSV